MALHIKLIQILFCLHRTGWIKTRPVQKLLVRVKFTGNSYSYRTCVNVNGHRWNTRKLVFTGTRIQVPGLVLVWMWTHPKVLSVKCSTFNVTGLYCGCVVFFWQHSDVLSIIISVSSAVCSFVWNLKHWHSWWTYQPPSVLWHSLQVCWPHKQSCLNWPYSMNRVIYSIHDENPCSW